MGGWGPTLNAKCHSKTHFFITFLKGRRKKRTFYGQANRKGGEGAATSALTLRKCKNFDIFFIEI